MDSPPSFRKRILTFDVPSESFPIHPLLSSLKGNYYTACCIYHFPNVLYDFSTQVYDHEYTVYFVEFLILYK